MERLSWDEFFMGVAQITALRSRDASTQVGACIVDKNNKIVSTGYNGMPSACDEAGLPWNRSGDWLDTKYPYVVHAELNAILNSTVKDLKGCKIYVTLFPCCECVKAILQSGITEIHYLIDKHPEDNVYLAAKKLIELSNIKCVEHMRRNESVVIDI